MWIIIQASLVLTTIGSAALALFIYTKNKPTYSHTLLVTHLLSITLWTLSTLLVLRHESALAVRVAFASAVLIAISKYLFVVTFAAKTTPTLRSLATPLLLATPIFILSFFDNVFVASFQSIERTYVRIENGPYALLYLGGISYLLLHPIMHLWRKIRTNYYTNHVAEQVRFLFLGITLFFILGLTTNSILPVVFDIYYFNGFGPSLALILAGFILYIINKHHFLQLYVFTQRSLVYSALITFITLTYIFTIFTLGRVVQHTWQKPIFSGLATTFIAIFSIPSIDRYLRKKTDTFFFQNYYDYSKVLHTLSEELARIIHVSKIETLTKNILHQALKPGTVILKLVNTSRTTKLVRHQISVNNNGTVTVPLISNSCLIGNLILSRKLSGVPYTTSDLQLLSTLSHHLAVSCERALLHERLREYSNSLEQEVSKRTAELHQAYAHQREIIINIAHGLQTPLTIVESELSTLESDSLTTTKTAALRRTLSTVSSFIYDLLRLAHIEATRLETKKESCNLSALVTEIISYVSVLTEEKNIVLHSQIMNDIFISADEKQIEEMILILISNAIKYIGSKPNKTITITLDQKYGFAQLVVTDTGIGIPSAQQDFVFNRCYRVKTPDTKNIPGTGLGLSIAKAIVEKHAGIISLQSQQHVGSAVTVQIPTANANSSLNHCKKDTTLPPL